MHEDCCAETRALCEELHSFAESDHKGRQGAGALPREHKANVIKGAVSSVVNQIVSTDRDSGSCHQYVESRGKHYI